MSAAGRRSPLEPQEWRLISATAPHTDHSKILRPPLQTKRHCCENDTMFVAMEGCKRFMIDAFARNFTLILATIAVLATASAADIRPESTAGDWRLLRSANPQGGADAVSMVHTADTSRSDFDLAGLMLRCDGKNIALMIVVVTPFPPRARPTVTISSDGKEWSFDATVISPGAELMLPMDAMGLVKGAWQSAHELAVAVRSAEQSFGGVVQIDGLFGALSTLTRQCPAP
jgi:hypothetical protein